MNAGNRSVFDAIIYHMRGKNWARQLDTSEYHDILDLWMMRILTITAKGKSITELYVDVSSHCSQPLKVVIPHGTYFKSRGSHQNMAARAESVFEIEPGKSRFLQLDATCLNAGRPIPGRDDHFRGVARADDEVVRFLKAANAYSAMAVQAGVWSLTDHLDRKAIRDRLYSLSSSGRRGSSISESDMDDAARLLDRLDIDSPLTRV